MFIPKLAPDSYVSPLLLLAYYQKLVIGAPLDDNMRGSIMVDEGVRVKGPAGGRLFGLRGVDVNQ